MSFRLFFPIGLTVLTKAAVMHHRTRGLGHEHRHKVVFRVDPEVAIWTFIPLAPPIARPPAPRSGSGRYG